MDPIPQLPDLTLLRPIGSGSYGQVWIARTLTGVYRAVKIVARATFEDERPFLRELDGITRFQQAVGDRPRQLALMHVGRDDAQGVFYYVMELADDAEAGTDIDPARYQPLTLKEYLHRRGVVPAEDVVRLGVELAEALVELHDAALIHRDVKPSNIIFVNGRPKLADIGLVSSADHTLTSLGTPGYAPPEGAGTAKADVYSLGKILYQLLTGLPPQEFPRLPPELMQRPDARAVIELNDVVLRACDPHPDARYASARAMLEDLRLLQAGRSVREFRRLRHQLRVFGRVAAVAAVLALVAVGVLGWRNFQQARELAARETAARQRAESDERLARYAADLHLAQVALGAGDLGVARTALRRQSPLAGAPDLRGLEWRALWNDSEGDARDGWGEPGAPAIRGIRLAPDGRRVAVQRVDGSLTLRERIGGEGTSLASGTHGLGDFAEGGRLVVGTTEREVRLLDLATGELGPAQTRGRVLQALGDGRTVLIGELVDGTVRLRLWDAIAGREVADWRLAGLPAPLHLAAFAAARDGATLAAAVFWNEGTLRREAVLGWDRASGQVRFTRPAASRARSATFSPDGRSLAIGRIGEPVVILRAESGGTQQTLPAPPGEVAALAFSPDGTQLALGGQDGSIHVWRWADRVGPRVLRGHEGPITSIQWPEPGAVVTGSADGTVRWWDPATDPARAQVDGLWANVLGDVVFAPDSSRLYATDSAGQVRMIDGATLRPTGRIDGLFHPLTTTDAGRYLLGLTQERTLARHDTVDAQTEPLGLRLEAAERLQAVAVSPSGHYAVLGLAAGAPRGWDLRAGREISARTGHEHPVWAAAVAPDDALAATGDAGGRIELWRPADGGVERRFTLENAGAASLAWSTDGRWFFAGRSDGAINVWDRGQPNGAPAEVLRGHSGSVTALAVSPDGTRLVSGGKDGFVLVWELAHFRPLAVLSLERTPGGGAASAISPLRFSPDGRRLAAWTEDGRVRVWRLD